MNRDDEYEEGEKGGDVREESSKVGVRESK